MRCPWPLVLTTLACAEVVPEEVPARAVSLGTLVVLEIPSRETADGVQGHVIRGSRLIERVDAPDPMLLLGFAESPEVLGWREGPLTHDARAVGRLRAPLELWQQDDNGWALAEERRGDRALRELRFAVSDEALCAQGEGCVAADPRAPAARWCAPCTSALPAPPLPPTLPAAGPCATGWSLTPITTEVDSSDELRAIVLCDAPATACPQVHQRHDALRGCVDLGPACPSAREPWAPTPGGRVRWVSPSGGTSGAGDAAAPWSLSHALSSAEADDTLLLARGVHTLASNTRVEHASRWVGACASETRITTTGTLAVAAPLELVGLELSSPTLALAAGNTLVAQGVVLEASSIEVPRGAHLTLEDAHVHGPSLGSLTVGGSLVASDTTLQLTLRAGGGQVTLRDVLTTEGTGLSLTAGAAVTADRLRMRARDATSVVEVAGSALTLSGSSITAVAMQSALRATAGSTVTVAHTWLHSGGGRGGSVDVDGSAVTLRDVVTEGALHVEGRGRLIVDRVVVHGSPGYAVRIDNGVLVANNLTIERCENGVQLRPPSRVAIERARLRQLQRWGVGAPAAMAASTPALATLELTDVLFEGIGGFGLSVDRVGTLALRRVAIRGVEGTAIVGDARTSRVLRAEDLDIEDVSSGQFCEGVSCTGVGLHLTNSADSVSLLRFRITGYASRAISLVSADLVALDGHIGPGPIGVDAPSLQPDELLNVQNLATEAWVR